MCEGGVSIGLKDDAQEDCYMLLTLVDLAGAAVGAGVSAEGFLDEKTLFTFATTVCFGAAGADIVMKVGGEDVMLDGSLGGILELGSGSTVVATGQSLYVWQDEDYCVQITTAREETW